MIVRGAHITEPPAFPHFIGGAMSVMTSTLSNTKYEKETHEDFSRFSVLSILADLDAMDFSNIFLEHIETGKTNIRAASDAVLPEDVVHVTVAMF